MYNDQRIKSTRPGLYDHAADTKLFIAYHIVHYCLVTVQSTR